jgi:hypothetical protein
MNEKRTLLKHFLAALAYRTQKALRDAPPDFGTFQAAAKVRTPHELIQHMDGVLGYARTFFVGGRGVGGTGRQLGSKGLLTSLKNSHILDVVTTAKVAGQGVAVIFSSNVSSACDRSRGSA